MEAGSYCYINNYDFVLLLKSFIANGLNCKARLKTNFKCMCVAMCSLVISLYVIILNGNRLNKVSAVF